MKKFLLVGLFLLTMFSFAGAATHDYVIGNAPGITVRADINSVLQAIVTNNSSATEPATLYPNMWWYDTSTSLLKRRNNANDAWIITGLEAADTDGTLAANSDLKIATQKATKTYADTKAAKGANSDITSLSGLTTPLSRAQGGLASTVANNAASGPVFLDANSKLPAVDGSQLTNMPSGMTICKHDSFQEMLLKLFLPVSAGTQVHSSLILMQNTSNGIAHLQLDADSGTNYRWAMSGKGCCKFA